MKLEKEVRSLSKLIKPMLLKKADGNSLDFYENNKFLASRKYDGTRAIAIKEDNKVIIFGRSGKFYEDKFGEIVEEIMKLPDGTILDGEIVCDTFQNTQRRTLTKNKFKIEEYRKLYPAKFMVFDCMAYEYADLIDFSLWERIGYLKILRERALKCVLSVGNTTNIKWLWATAQNENWEGIVIKNPNSNYQFGRSADWLKLKTTKQRVIEFDSYTVNLNGVRAENKKGISVQVGGVENSRKFKEQFEKFGKVDVLVEFLEEFESGMLRMPVCVEVKE